METRMIGPPEVSVAGLGYGNFGGRLDERAAAAAVHAALDSGVTFFDTADIYGGTKSEAFLGRALGRRRAEVVIASKFGKPVGDGRGGAHPEYVRRAAEDSLRRLGTDRIDLYQLHEPDPAVPIEDTLGALDDLVRAGKVRAVGASNFSAAQLRDAAGAVREGAARFVSVQNEYSLLRRASEREVLPACGRLGLAFIPYFPLASGLLTGKYRGGRSVAEGGRIPEGHLADVLTERNLDVVEGLRAFAEGRGHTLLELASSWLLARPGVASVIAGASAPEQVRANAAAVRWGLSAAELAGVDAVGGGWR